MKTRDMSTTAALALFCVALACALCTQAWAEQEKELARERGPVVIDGKGPNQLNLGDHYFTKYENNRFGIAFNPLIYDVDGKVIELKDLKIPCEAIIEYKWVRGKIPEVHRIEVKKYGEKADPNFTLPVKKPRPPM